MTQYITELLSERRTYGPFTNDDERWDFLDKVQDASVSTPLTHPAEAPYRESGEHSVTQYAIEIHDDPKTSYGHTTTYGPFFDYDEVLDFLRIHGWDKSSHVIPLNDREAEA